MRVFKYCLSITISLFIILCFNIKSYGLDYIQVNPNPINIGTVEQGQHVTFRVKVTNISDSGLWIVPQINSPFSLDKNKKFFLASSSSDYITILCNTANVGEYKSKLKVICCLSPDFSGSYYISYIPVTISIKKSNNKVSNPTVFISTNKLELNNNSTNDREILTEKNFINIMEQAHPIDIVDIKDIKEGRVNLSKYKNIVCLSYNQINKFSNIDRTVVNAIMKAVDEGSILYLNYRAAAAKILYIAGYTPIHYGSGWGPALRDSYFFTDVDNFPLFDNVKVFHGNPQTYGPSYWDKGDFDFLIWRVDNRLSYGPGELPDIKHAYIPPTKYIAKGFGTSWSTGRIHPIFPIWKRGKGYIVILSHLSWVFDQKTQKGGYVGKAGRQVLYNIAEGKGINISNKLLMPSDIKDIVLPQGIKIYWSGVPGASYYKYSIYKDNNLIKDKATTDSPFITIPSDEQSHTIKIQISACIDSYNCTKPVEKTFKLPANPLNLFVGNFTRTQEFLKTSDPIDQTRNDYTNESQNKNPGIVAEPIEIATGDFAYSHIDMVVPAPGVPFIVERFYNSLDYKKGWYFSFQNSLDISNIDNVKVYWGEKGRGGISIFIKAGDKYIDKYGMDSFYIHKGEYIVEKPSGLKYIFDKNGKEIAIKNKQGLGIEFEYPNNNTIIVKDIFGNTLAKIFLYNNKINAITDCAGNTIYYTYDINGNIISFTDRNGQTTTYEYNDAGYLSSIIGPDGTAYVENTYDSKGRVIAQNDAEGHTTTFYYYFNTTNPNLIDKASVTYPNGVSITYDVNLCFIKKQSIDNVSVQYGYDVNNNIDSIKDPYGRLWKFKRNNIGLITELIDPEGNKYTYLYDKCNNLLEIKNPLGKQISFKYDTNNNLTKIIYPNNSTTIIKYNDNNLPIKIVNTAGQITQYTYNKRGFISSIILPNKGKIKYTYDNIGDIVSIINPIGNKTFYKYNKNGKIICITDALGHETKFSYDAYGDLIKITDPKGRTIKAEYNSDGLLTKLILPDNSTIENTYDALGRIIETKDTLGRVTKREYDNFGRLSKIITPKGNTLTFVYDKVGNLTDIIDSKGNSVKMEYDNLYRLVKSYDAYGNLISQIDYNVIGLPTKISDADGKTLEFFYDSLNRLKQATLAGSITARAEYNALGRIAKLIDPKGYETKYNYNNIGELIRETNPLGNSWTYNYDLAGRLIKSSLPDGTKVTYTYDAINRLSQIEFQKDNKSKYIYYSYDKIGNLLSVEDNVGDIRYNYDSMNRVVQRKDTFGNIVRYQYDSAGRLIKLIYPDGKAITYSYDADNNLIQIKDFKGNITQFKYDEDDNLIKTIYPNGYYTVYTYDDNNRLTSIKNYNPNGVEVTGDELIKDKSGNIISLKKTEYIEPNFSKIKSFNFTVNQFNQIINSNEGLFNYDKKGNLLSYIYNGKKITLKYDIANRLVEADIGNNIYTYKYDAEGNRIEVTKNGQTTRYIIDNVMGLSKPIAEVDSLNNIRRYYIWGNNGLIYSIDPHGRLYIYLYNYRGDTTAVVDNTGKVIAAYTYSAYGKILNEYGKISNPFKFLGKYGVMSDNNNLYYIRARYYSPDLGRFVQVDLVNLKVPLPLFINRYTHMPQGTP